uniref:NADH-ubiquinone oxidoreductase chain 6 n=1 Tax=Minois dryas TaxID=270472 RepID=A0A6G6CDL9_9NEOP|nr:NADH dehydrogenase subunit 6 [Minois dryas]QGX06843.1 NADH dehydrogenase subunit 6 [Minois dryas]QID90303.1 NADH dehydrogenase subunit 6 [Minois dryas]USH57590.1 NADH dehydrogenase subunit 6 [Papilio bianor]USN89406.1 NADH dehydrogenase subunit 6 [Minois dryas]
MTKMFMSLMVIFLAIFMFFINHPISMGLLILFQTLLICILLGMLINTYWFSYILFLVFLGGLLVLFIYISSIASNELMNISLINKFNFIIPFVILLISILMKNNLNWLNFSMNEDMNNFINMFLFSYNENNINLFKLYNEQTYLLMIMMIIYLFITLIAVVKITNIFFGPLRSFN